MRVDADAQRAVLVHGRGEPRAEAAVHGGRAHAAPRHARRHLRRPRRRAAVAAVVLLQARHLERPGQHRLDALHRGGELLHRRRRSALSAAVVAARIS